MKKIFFIIIPFMFICCNEAEKQPEVKNAPVKSDTLRQVLPPASEYTAPDRSPMDMVYFPADYPLLKMAGNAPALPMARIIYSRPQKQGRKIFGELVKYNEPWRLGANEATELELFSAAVIQNKTVNPGRYILYCIPQETKWTFILNSNMYSWGLQQNRQKDLLQFDAPVEKNNSPVEFFTIAFEKTSAKSANLIFLWDDVKTKLAVSF